MVTLNAARGLRRSFRPPASQRVRMAAVRASAVPGFLSSFGVTNSFRYIALPVRTIVVMSLIAQRTLSLSIGALAAWVAAVCVVNATFSLSHTRFSAVMSWVLAFAIPAVAAGFAIWATWPRAATRAQADNGSGTCL